MDKKKEKHKLDIKAVMVAGNDLKEALKCKY